jgi:hypothetical protein
VAQAIAFHEELAGGVLRPSGVGNTHLAPWRIDCGGEPLQGGLRANKRYNSGVFVLIRYYEIAPDVRVRQ